MGVKNSLFTFGLVASSLVMLVLVPFLNQQQNSFSNVMDQEYDKYRVVIKAKSQQMIRSMSVEQAHLKDFL